MNSISYVAYELYKQNWIDKHTTKGERLKSIRIWGESEIKNDNEDLVYSYKEWQEEYAYPGGILYACYDEFIDEEYQDREFMKKLLKSKFLIQAYLDDEEELLYENPDEDDE